MNPFEMVVMIVAIVMIASVAKARHRNRWERPAEDQRADDALAGENRVLRDELRQLKARVATLERIATDRSSELDREIEALRDRP